MEKWTPDVLLQPYQDTTKHEIPNLFSSADAFQDSSTQIAISPSFFYRDNFLQVDIFYQELSYEKIEQNIAFEFLSLLSEVGGFLGLLLGASVLTVCELLDYVALLAINKIRKKKLSDEHELKSISIQV